MTTGKLRDALADLQGQRIVLDAAIARLEEVLNTLETSPAFGNAKTEPTADEQAGADTGEPC